LLVMLERHADAVCGGAAAVLQEQHAMADSLANSRESQVKELQVGAADSHAFELYA
jgi:hypothetical protein